MAKGSSGRKEALMLFNPTKAAFSRHETFALRYSWLTKGYQALSAPNGNTIFSDEGATVVLGVGKNMVNAIRYWLQAAQLIKPAQPGFKTTPLGDKIFGSNMDYYEKNATAFVKSTRWVDMQPLYQQFLPLLSKQAHIPDAGCGSGRDAKQFVELGYKVTAFDASAKIAALAEKEIGQPVSVQRLQDIQYQNQFDGIWACASLLHVPAKALADVFQRLARALKPQGVIYCSFKYGQNEYEKQGRQFTDMDEAGLQVLVDEIDGLAIKELWVTADRRPGREQERWLNGVLVG